MVTRKARRQTFAYAYGFALFVSVNLNFRRESEIENFHFLRRVFVPKILA